MKLQKQLIPDHSPAEGSWGDCFRTCVAILIDRDAADVPHFVQIAEELQGEAKGDCDALARSWLATQGYVMMSICVTANSLWTNKIIEKLTSGMPYILTGKSPRFEDASHCVIAQGGANVIWCPAVGTEPQKNIAPWLDSDSGDRIWTIDVIVRPL